MNNIMENYNDAVSALYKHVGFTPDWVLCPIDDCTDMYWVIINDNMVRYGNVKDDVIFEDGNYYEDDIYTQRFYSKHVYEGKDFTMIFCDPHTDGVKWFRVFDNSKRLYQENVNDEE